jgi:hypothetical protein
MLSAWSASFLEDMTRTSWATNLQDCDARQFWLSGKAISHQLTGESDSMPKTLGELTENPVLQEVPRRIYCLDIHS